MSLISKWNAIVAGCEEAAAEHNHEGPYAVAAEARGAAFSECARDLEAAYTPRPPKAEWFGEGDGKWDSWMIQLGGDNWFLLRGAKTIKRGTVIYDEMSDDYFTMTSVSICVPVTREGFPSPAGWSVVGG